MRSLRWQTILTWAAIAAAVALAFVVDRTSARWVERLSAEGSPPPARDAQSRTGYVGGQRYFLGLHERGDTYRWIAATQRIIAEGPLASSEYRADNVPTVRRELLPRLYAYWLASVAWTWHVATNEPVAIAAERIAVWEPTIGHLLLLLGTAWFFARRFGAAGAVGGALIVAVFPLVSDQFLAGTLSPRPWALFFAAYAIIATMFARRTEATKPNTAGSGRSTGSGSEGDPVLHQFQSRVSVTAAIAAAFALWLDPAIGFPAVLVCALGAACAAAEAERAAAALRWASVGAGLSIVGWLLDRSPLTVAAGELRYVHPWYALAWLGLGVALHVRLTPRAPERKRSLRIVQIVLALGLLAPLAFAQVKHGYRGWLFPSAALGRLTSLDETIRFGSLPHWLGAVSALELFVVALPTCLGAIVCGWSAMSVAAASRRRSAAGCRSYVPTLGMIVAYVALLVLAIVHVRWLCVTSLIALPLVVEFAARQSPVARIAWLTTGAVFFAFCAATANALPSALRKPGSDAVATAADLEALVGRHFAQWLASHNAGQPVSALAPPELSDSLVFHGGCRVLMSTAWESFDGQVAASRILSSPEATEAEAMVQSRELTHLVLTSWDAVLPLLVREPKEADRTTLYARLQRWVLPAYLRPLAYRLPPIAGFETQKLAVFKVTGAQDEALLLARLAEYFAEEERPEPATLAAKVLRESFANDPNATIARAVVAATTQHTAEFEAELGRLAAAPTVGEATLPWDRRVQRAIVFALGKRHDLARAALTGCIADASKEQMADLTPLEAHRLLTLMKAYDLSFSDSSLGTVAAAMGAEYGGR
jgi:hypothetical protein